MLRRRRFGLLTAFLAIAMLLVVDGAQSRQRSKQFHHLAKSQPKPQPQQSQQPTAADQRGTEQSPLAVKVISTPKSEEEAARDRSEREDNAERDRKLVKFNGELAYYTQMLFWVAVFQFIALFIQAIMLGGTFLIARTALRDLERAIVFGFTILHGLDENGNMILMPQCTNYGRSFAVLKQIRIGTSDDEPLSSIPDYSKLESHRYDLVVQPNAPMTDRHVTITHSAEKPFYCFGYFKYLDIFSREHISRFCGRTHHDLYFETAGHPAWNEWD